MFGKEKKRPSSADTERSTSSKFVRPCSAESGSRPASAKSSSTRSSSPSTPKKTPSPTIKKKPAEPGKSVRPLRSVSVDGSGSAKSSRPSSAKERQPKMPRAFSTNSSPKPSRDGSPKPSSGPCSASAGVSPKSSRQSSPAGLPLPKSRSPVSLMFRRWGSPFPPSSKNSTRPCSPDYTVVSFEDTGFAISQNKPPQTKDPRGQLSPENTLKFACGSNPATKRLMQIAMCAANARAPFPEAKVRKLVFYKSTDKENLLDELQSMKVAVADQTYHFQLHKSHLRGLQIEQNELEEKIVALESIVGSNAPRTGGQGRLIAKIAGLRIRIGNLEDDITKYHETIQNLKYRYQVCQTREVSIQRDMATGDVWRLQKEVRNTKDILLALTQHNRKFLHLRNKILPNLQEIQRTKQENIQDVKLSIKGIEKLSKQSTDESYAWSKAADKAKKRAKSLSDEGKKLRAKLKNERESKRKNQQDLWIVGYETCMLVKENKHVEKQKKLREAAKAAKARAEEQRPKKGRKKRWRSTSSDFTRQGLFQQKLRIH